MSQTEHRIVSEPGWQVQTFYKGEWITAWYCKDAESAKRALKRTIEQQEKWAKMTGDERRRAILRRE